MNTVDLKECQQMKTWIRNQFPPTSMLEEWAKQRAFRDPDDPQRHTFVIPQVTSPSDPIARLLKPYAAQQIPNLMALYYYAPPTTRMHKHRLSPAEQRAHQAIKVALVEFDEDGQMRLDQLASSGRPETHLNQMFTQKEYNWEHVHHPIRLQSFQDPDLYLHGIVLEHHLHTMPGQKRRGVIVVSNAGYVYPVARPVTPRLELKSM